MKPSRSSDYFEIECGGKQQSADVSAEVQTLDESAISSEVFVLDDTDPSLTALEILKDAKDSQLGGALRSLHQALSVLEKTSAGRRAKT